jgi:16S rRNA (guanine966-N2)-methyltransferase
MSEKIRGAIFNMLGDISGLSVLDAFAGSGALALEAISRGASKAVALDSDSAAIAIITRNAHSLQLKNKLTITHAPLHSWLQTQVGATFDIIFADPPYNDPHITGIQELETIVAPGGIVVVSLPPTAPTPQFTTLQPVRAKSYGDARIHVFTTKK